MKLSERKKNLKFRLKKIRLCPKEDLEDTADSLSSQESSNIKTNSKPGKFNQLHFHQIFPSLFMSGYQSAQDLKRLKRKGISHVINLTAHYCPNLHLNDLTYSNFELSDTCNFDLTPFLNDIVDHIEQLISKGHKVLVHCKMGVSRAPSIIIAFLILRRKMNYTSAFDYVFTVNSKISPNFGFLMQLQNL